MNALMIVLRIAHIVGGVLWAGSAIFYVLFVEPSVKAVGPAGPRFMRSLIEERRYPLFMNVASIVTVLAGAALLWLASGGLQMAWLTSGPGIGFTLGALVAIVVWFMGFLMLRPRANEMGAIGAQVAAAGGPPSEEQASRLRALGEEMARIGRIDAMLLLISLLLMATARYWNF